MSHGLAGLTQATKGEPLPFSVSMYCGDMFVTGRVAPNDWFHLITAKAQREELWHRLRKVKDEAEKRSTYEAAITPANAALDQASGSEPPEPDEVTLVDVQVFPAVGTQGTRSGGHSVPVIRIPHSAVDLWWIIDGDEIRGRGGANFGFGFLFPIGN